MMSRTIAPTLVLCAALLGPTSAGAQTRSGAPDGGIANGETITVRAKDTMVAAELQSSIVVDEAGEELGDVESVLLSRDGRIVALVVGVGGLLGMAERPVAIRYDALRAEDAEDGVRFVSRLGRKALEAAPAYRKR